MGGASDGVAKIKRLGLGLGLMLGRARARVWYMRHQDQEARVMRSMTTIKWLGLGLGLSLGWS
jgi:hypothetical protein